MSKNKVFTTSFAKIYPLKGFLGSKVTLVKFFYPNWVLERIICWCEIWSNTVIRTSKWWCANEKGEIGLIKENTTVFRVVRPSSVVIAYVHFYSILGKFLTKVLTNFSLTSTPFSFPSLYRSGEREGFLRFDTQSPKSRD